MPMVQDSARYQYRNLEKQYMISLNYMVNFMVICKNYMARLVSSG